MDVAVGLTAVAKRFRDCLDACTEDSVKTPILTREELAVVVAALSERTGAGAADEGAGQGHVEAVAPAIPGTGLRFKRDKLQPTRTRVLSGSLQVGLITEAGEMGYRWILSLSGYSATALHGFSATKVDARRAFRRAWRSVLRHAGLMHAP